MLMKLSLFILLWGTILFGGPKIDYLKTFVGIPTTKCKLYFEQVTAKFATIANKDTLNESQINELYASVAMDAVASLEKYGKYDPFNNGTGFCFGRATACYLHAREMGLSEDSIKKVWIYGSLKTGNKSWKYHVAAMVKREDGELVVIDPIVGEPLVLNDWLFKMSTEYDPKNTMQIRVTEGEKIFSGRMKEVGFDSKEWFSMSEPKIIEIMNGAHLHGFFQDLLFEFVPKEKRKK